MLNPSVKSVSLFIVVNFLTSLFLISRGCNKRNDDESYVHAGKTKGRGPGWQ
jgi:hypothetical protein